MSTAVPRVQLPAVPATSPAAKPTHLPELRPRTWHLRAIVWTALIGLAVAAGAQAVRVARRPAEVAVVHARAEDVTRVLAVTGRIEAERAVVVTPQFAGRLTEIVRREGDVVRAGDVLARLEDTAATSAVVQQRLALSSRRTELAQANRELSRVQRLVATGAVPVTELEAAQLVATRATDDVARLAAMLQSGRSQLLLSAPFDGTIVRREGELGQVVGPSTPVFEIATVDASRVSAEVDERYVGALRPGMRAEIVAAGAAHAPEAATVAYVAQAVDPQTGAATVRFAYASMPKGALMGMSVDVNVQVAFVPAAITVPREAIGGDRANAYVLVVVGERVERRAVEIEDWPAPSVVVRSGVKAGELVVLDPTAAVVGAQVRTAVRDGV